MFIVFDREASSSLRWRYYPTVGLKKVSTFNRRWSKEFLFLKELWHDWKLSVYLTFGLLILFIIAGTLEAPVTFME